jgi:hypothetical protein
LPDRSFNRVRKTDQLKRSGRFPKFLSLQRANLFVVEGGHEICGDFSRFLVRYGEGRILFATLKDVFQRAAIFGPRLGIETTRWTLLEIILLENSLDFNLEKTSHASVSIAMVADRLSSYPVVPKLFPWTPLVPAASQFP